MTIRRGDRVADQIRAELARALREDVRDPLLGFVTLTTVRLASDLRTARVYISVLDRDVERTLAALRRATPFLRRVLARNAGLRFTPELHFVFDPSLVTGSRIEDLLRAEHETAQEPADPAADSPTSAPEGEQG
jgi:ribosome-binding factor A